MERLQVAEVTLIYELWNEYAAAANDGDIARWISLWCDEGIQMPPGVPRRVGKEQIQKGMQPLFEISNTTMTVHPNEVRVLGDQAYSHGAFEIEILDKEDGRSESLSGNFLSILEKQGDGSWKIAIDCHNFDSPSD
jgi:uncharacterized protein (TIGR02246 family)